MISEAFSKAWAETGRAEAGYVNNPNDAGGATNHGITERVARAHGYKGDMKDLPKETATEIAKLQYWDVMWLDSVAAISLRVAKEMFDTGINCGPAVATKILQRSLNAMNKRGAIYADVDVDGLMDQLCIYSLKQYLAHRGTEGETVLLRALNSLQGAYYTEITEHRDKNEDFVYGWFRNRVAI